MKTMYTNIKMMCLAMLALVTISCSSNDEDGYSFYGYIYDGSDRKIQFDLESTTFSDWDYYKKKGYRDFTTSYRAPGLSASQVSVATGVFAEKLNSMK